MPTLPLCGRMSDASDSDEVEAIKERKKEKLLSDDDPESPPPDEPVGVDGKPHLGEVVTDNDVVIVDFYADWCGPCQMLEPVVESVAEETGAVVAKVDVDAHQALAGEYGVRGVPTLYLFVDGEPVEQLVGMQDEATLRELVEGYT